MSGFHPWRHRFGLLTAACTLALIFIGGLVTSTGSGLAVPDWPLSYGCSCRPW
jgi:cytochrome c oxidase assembly protein subunit 15